MGSSPKNDTSGAPAPKGPPIEQLNPPQPPPVYPQFIEGAGIQRGLTPEMLAAIDATQPQNWQGAGSDPGAAAGTGSLSRDQLAAMIAEILGPQQPQGMAPVSSDQSQLGRWAGGGSDSRAGTGFNRASGTGLY